MNQPTRLIATVALLTLGSPTFGDATFVGLHPVGKTSGEVCIDGFCRGFGPGDAEFDWDSLGVEGSTSGGIIDGYITINAQTNLLSEIVESAGGIQFVCVVASGEATVSTSQDPPEEDSANVFVFARALHEIRVDETTPFTFRVQSSNAGATFTGGSSGVLQANTTHELDVRLSMDADFEERRATLYLSAILAFTVPGDINLDGRVDFEDILRLLNQWGEDGGLADVNDDGIVDFEDVLTVLLAWS